MVSMYEIKRPVWASTGCPEGEDFHPKVGVSCHHRVAQTHELSKKFPALVGYRPRAGISIAGLSGGPDAVIVSFDEKLLTSVLIERGTTPKVAEGGTPSALVSWLS